METWKDIAGYNGFYQVSNRGNVRSKNGLRKISYTHDGYAKVRLLANGKDRTERVHRLVAETFIPNVCGKETVNHKDGNKKNNNVDNLEWQDRREQMRHAYKHGLKKPMRGEKNKNAKLTEQQAQEIRREYIRHSKERGTVAFAERYGVTNAVISRVVRGVGYG